jgi:regulatory protein
MKSPKPQKSRKQQTKQRTVRVPTEQYLENVALWYVQRFAATTTTLTRVLQRRIQNAVRAHPDFNPAPFSPIITKLVEKCVQLGYINDAAFAESKIISLRRKGTSARIINAKLREKGLTATVNNNAEDDYIAACQYIKRKRLGPHRTRTVENAAQKDLAALARAGFSGAVARRALGFLSHGDGE